MNAVFDPYYKWLGISPDEWPASFYRLLAISDFEADSEVIAHAVDRRLAYLGQQLNGPEDAAAQQLLAEVHAAQETLLIPASKASYDRFLRELRGLPAYPPPVPNDAVTADSKHSIPPVVISNFNGDAATGNAEFFLSLDHLTGRRDGTGRIKRSKKSRGLSGSAIYLAVVWSVAVTLLGVYFVLRTRMAEIQLAADERAAAKYEKDTPQVVRPAPVRQAPLVDQPVSRPESPQRQSDASMGATDSTRANSTADRPAKAAIPIEEVNRDAPRRAEKLEAIIGRNLQPGSFWTGKRTYQRGAYQGVTVNYYLNITERSGSKFKANKFDQAPNRNHADVEGEIEGDVITWRERVGAFGYLGQMRGVLNADGTRLEVTFTGRYGSGASYEGDGFLEISRNQN